MHSAANDSLPNKTHGDPLPALTDVLDDHSFRALLRLSQRKAMTWDTFLAHSLPPNMSPLSVWDMLSTIGQCIGVHLFPDEENDMLWYRRTHELSDLVDDIERRSSEGSPLYDALLAHADRALALGLHLTEAVSASKLGGLSVDSDHLEMHIKLKTPPTLPAERVVANAVAISADLLSFANQPFSESLFAEFFARLTEGVDAEGLQSLTAAPENDPLDERAWAVTQQQLARIIEYANYRHDKEDLAVLRGNIVGDAIRYRRLYGFAGPFVASFASKLFYLKHDLPVLSLVPISSAKLRWTEGLLDDRTLCSFSEYESTRRRTCCDLTVHHTLSAQCIEIALDETEALFTGIASKDRAAKFLLSSDFRFNHRQRSILARALRTPMAEFHIRYHQEKNRISYATARRDLVALADAGYLRAEQRGKTFVFVAAERISEFSRTLSQ